MVGENNPYWIMAEPMLLKIWADEILRTPSLNLHIANVFSLIVNMIFFVGGVALRVAAVMAALLLGYFAFPQTLFIAFETIVDTNFAPSRINNFWLYRLLGLAILIKISLFLLNGFTVFVRDLIIYLR